MSRGDFQPRSEGGTGGVKWLVVAAQAFVLTIGSYVVGSSPAFADVASVRRASEDSLRILRSWFGIRLSDGWGNDVNTVAGTVTKDRVSCPDTTIHMPLSDAELDQLDDLSRSFR